MTGRDYYQVPNTIKKDRIFGIRTGEPLYTMSNKKGKYRFINSFRDNNPMRQRSFKNQRLRSGGVGGVPAKSGKSYHFTNRSTPKSHKQRDTEWINNQDASGYTIELASDDNPQSVAKALFNTPKEQRMAQYKQQHKGKVVHKGIYGSFADRNAAKQALDKLPAEVKAKAKVKPWSKAQDEARTVASASQDTRVQPPSVKKETNNGNGNGVSSGGSELSAGDDSND